MTSGALNPPTEARKRQQGPCRTASYASTGHKALLRRPHWYIHRAQGASPTATLLPIQGSRHFPASHVSTQLHPHCTAGHLLVSIKGDDQGPTERGEEERRARDVRTHGRTTQTSGGRQSRRDAVEVAPDCSPQGRALSFSLSLVLALPQRL
jgi:hypothetical protein